MDENLKELKDKVEKLEYVEIKGLKEDVNNLKLDLSTEKLLTQQNITSVGKLNDTMVAMKDAMLEISNAVRDCTSNTKKLSGELGVLSNKVDKFEEKVDRKIADVNAKIDAVDNKGKFDWVEYVKQNFITWVIGIGALAYFLTQLIK